MFSTLLAFLPDQEVPEGIIANVFVNQDTKSNVINNSNNKTSKVTISLLDSIDVFDTNKAFTLKVKNADGAYIKKSTAYHRTEDWSQSISLPATAKTFTTANIDFTADPSKNFQDGIYTFELLETVNDKAIVRGTTTVTINTAKPDLDTVAKITTKRDNSEKAEMSLEYAGEDQLTKIYYKVVKSNDPAILDATKLT